MNNSGFSLVNACGVQTSSKVVDVVVSVMTLPFQVIKSKAA